MIRAGAYLFKASEESLYRQYAPSTNGPNPGYRDWCRERVAGQLVSPVPPPRFIACGGRIDDSFQHAHDLVGYRGGFWLAPFAPALKNKQVAGSGFWPRALPVQNTINLRKSQRRGRLAWGSRPARPGGVIEAACGFGKTQLALKLACGVSTNVLILVNSNALLEQWKERIEKNTEARCFHWNSLHGSTGRFTIATIQYVSQRCWRERWELGAAHGMLIVDECHRLPAHTFAPTVAALPCKIRLGLTATPRRSDGLGAWDALNREASKEETTLVEDTGHYLKDILHLGYSLHVEQRISLDYSSQDSIPSAHLQRRIVFRHHTVQQELHLYYLYIVLAQHQDSLFDCSLLTIQLEMYHMHLLHLRMVHQHHLEVHLVFSFVVINLDCKVSQLYFLGLILNLPQMEYFL